MELHLVQRAVLPQPPTNGTHEFAWNVILDAIFADAYHAGIGELTVHLPILAMQEGLELRGQLTRAKGARRAILCSGLYDLGDGRFDRVYTIEHGGIMGGRIRAHTAIARKRWTARHQMWVYTLRTRVLGVPIRLGLWLRRPDLTDHLHARARLAFVSRRPAFAYYHVTVWEPSVDVVASAHAPAEVRGATR